MAKFLRKLFWFLLPCLATIGVGLLLPATPRVSKSFLFAGLQKDSLLKATESPRIIFIGGSNLSMGLNSQMIKDLLHLNPINTGLTFELGLKYMLENTLQYIRPSDVVVLVPEYSLYYSDYRGTSEMLLRMVLDADPAKIKLLDYSQRLQLISFLPEYALSKLKPSEYFDLSESEIYGYHSFNRYGDTDAHWGRKRAFFYPFGKIENDFDPLIVLKIREFQAQILKRNAFLLLSFPGYQDISYDKSAEKISRVEAELRKNGLTVLGTPERYRMADSLLFDLPYHLTKTGVDYRTRLFIEDYRGLLSTKPPGFTADQNHSKHSEAAPSKPASLAKVALLTTRFFK